MSLAPQTPEGYYLCMDKIEYEIREMLIMADIHLPDEDIKAMLSLSERLAIVFPMSAQRVSEIIVLTLCNRYLNGQD